MKLKHLLLGIAFIGCCGLFLTSCERDEMGVGSTGGGPNSGGQDPDSMARSIHDSSTNEVNDTISLTTPVFEND